MNEFKINNFYTDRNNNEYYIMKRTEKMITFYNCIDNEVKKAKIHIRDNKEIFYPYGKYSQCLICKSSHYIS